MLPQAHARARPQVGAQGGERGAAGVHVHHHAPAGLDAQEAAADPPREPLVRALQWVRWWWWMVVVMVVVVAVMVRWWMVVVMVAVVVVAVMVRWCWMVVVVMVVVVVVVAAVVDGGWWW